MAGIIADVAVVGGGLTGLASAALLARRGLDVLVLERASELGGRGVTHVRDGYCFNLGAHALYLGGAAARVLGGLGVTWTGKAPPASGVAVLGGSTFALPVSAGSLLTTGLLGWSAKVQGGRLMARLGSIDTRALAGVPLQAWLDESVSDPTMRATVEAFTRVTTYTNAPSLLDAGAAIAQIRQGQRPGVVYLDGGWQTLVDGVGGAGKTSGVRVRAGARVTCAMPHAGGWRVSLAGDDPVTCRALVLATGPAAARSIVASDALASWAHRAIPVRAACLDVALARLPDERTTFALGVDQPLYFSVHSRSARVAPPGAALVSTMKYLSPTAAPDAAGDEAELDGLLDLLQPGWRDVLVERRWLPGMIASNALVTATGGGLTGRPGPSVPDAPGVFIAGDWVGGEGMLLDASLASAEQAAAAVTDMLAVARVA